MKKFLTAKFFQKHKNFSHYQQRNEQPLFSFDCKVLYSLATENKGFIQLEVASVSFITDTQQCYYMYTGRGEPARNNCRSLSVMLNFCGSHHRVRTRSTASGVQGDAKVHLSTLLCHLHVIVCVTQFRVIFHPVFLSISC